MRKCKRHNADVVIDGTPYRLTTLAELNKLEKLHRMHGIQIMNEPRTRGRLWKEQAAMRVTRQE